MLDAFGVESGAGTNEVLERDVVDFVGDHAGGCGVCDTDFAEADGVGGPPLSLPLGGGGEKVRAVFSREVVLV